jgi:hypothetical protein
VLVGVVVPEPDVVDGTGSSNDPLVGVISATAVSVPSPTGKLSNPEFMVCVEPLAPTVAE